MASTSIPAVKAALYAKLQTLSELTSDNVDIRYAEHPERRRNSVYLGATDLSDIERTAFRAGRHRRTENYTIELMVEATDINVALAEAKAFGYVSAIESALVDDPKLGDTPSLSWVVVSRIESEPLDNAEGSYCQVTVELEAQAQFT